MNSMMESLLKKAGFKCTDDGVLQAKKYRSGTDEVMTFQAELEDTCDGREILPIVIVYEIFDVDAVELSDGNIMEFSTFVMLYCN